MLLKDDTIAEGDAPLAAFESKEALSNENVTSKKLF